MSKSLDFLLRNWGQQKKRSWNCIALLPTTRRTCQFLVFLVGIGLISFVVGIDEKRYKVAIIGGGVSGSFTSKYLVDYDSACTIESITIFDPQPVHKNQPYDVPVAATTADGGGGINRQVQTSRVASARLSDGSIIELGASIAYKNFHLIVEMLHGATDPPLQVGPPMQQPGDTALREGMGIYRGLSSGEFSQQPWAINTVGTSSWYRKLKLLYRYNYDFLKVNSICQRAQDAFAELPDLLASADPKTFYESPSEIWTALGLANASDSSFGALLDVLGVQETLPLWLGWLPGQGSLRQELLAAINLVNYNQDVDEVTGLTGLGSFAAATGGLFSVVGGNYQIITTALDQANSTRIGICQQQLQDAAAQSTNAASQAGVQQVQASVSTVVGTLQGLELYSESEALGTYDVVVLAAPLQQSKIHFYVQSHWDTAALLPMPLGGLIPVHDDASTTEDGHHPLPAGLPDSAHRPYTQVVTTVVRNADLQPAVFSLSDPSQLPRSILMTNSGKASLHNITAITQLSSSGVYKVFSNDVLNDVILKTLFGPDYVTEIVQLWGGPHGGATPDYQGQGSHVPFLLFDAAIGLEGYTQSGALYYPIAMEQSSLASMEIAGIGAKAVAKLIARRLGLIQPTKQIDHDEL